MQSVLVDIIDIFYTNSHFRELDFPWWYPIIPLKKKLQLKRYAKRTYCVCALFFWDTVANGWINKRFRI